MDEETDEVEQQHRQFEYGIWRQNAAFLYGMLGQQESKQQHYVEGTQLADVCATCSASENTLSV
jgi:hypothetical protein